ncbi:hypothetical protein GCK72_014214 [Caenorhabditis remanei]|uniref:Uncharacterized protein n=1 Tax=Caenorhabditis remanei TaxID=31234 RepID=A0A6A5GQN4_CAERE|nr:hypothetical protein GCK72_014214 [Caenorhabditis remanei]KAF1757758.1 hypothetical protein GCK72_014214 [Caenorhabditis remanei]
MRSPTLKEQPPLAPLSSCSSSGSDFLTSSTTSGTTESSGTSVSSIKSSDTNYGVASLKSDCSDDAMGTYLSPEEANWLKLAHEYTASEKPFKEQKGFHVARKLRTWHPKRSVSWSFLRRLYNGRQDMKEEQLANIADMSIEEKK